MRPPVTLPEGYRALAFPTLDSTNAEALRRAASGEAGGLWIQADVQTAGRGRQGRDWQSSSGNLFASLLLRPACDLATAQQLAFVAALAACDAASSLRGSDRGLKLKWPNDLLLDGAKVAGILLESAGSAEMGHAVVIGTGLNLAHAPQDTARPATQLAMAGELIEVREAFHALARSTGHWLAVWLDGLGWSRVRTEWMARGPDIGQRLRINCGGEAAEGAYAGLDSDGALLLDTGGPAPQRFLVGDVFVL
ncbi:MAG: biotin--[acetyl-CoA-carboxylase] ligase [Hyphomicrobiales bacterium]